MDTAFYNRTGFTSGWSFGEVNFYPKASGNFWLKRVHPYYWAKRGRGEVQDGNEGYLTTGIRFNFVRQGFLTVSHGSGHEPWVGQQFETGGGISTYGQVQIFRWLNINGNFNKGRQIYYKGAFQGQSSSGGVGLWTKSDAVSYFTDLRIQYKPREILAQSLVRDALKKYPRLLGLQIFAPGLTNDDTLRIVASKNPGEIGQIAPDKTDEVLAGKGFVYAKDSQSVMVIMPLHDWNGERVAAVKVLMNTFAGQTEKNAVTRAAPIVKSMEARVQSVKDLVQ